MVINFICLINLYSTDCFIVLGLTGSCPWTSSWQSTTTICWACPFEGQTLSLSNGHRFPDGSVAWRLSFGLQNIRKQGGKKKRKDILVSTEPWIIISILRSIPLCSHMAYKYTLWHIWKLSIECAMFGNSGGFCDTCALAKCLLMIILICPLTFWLIVKNCQIRAVIYIGMYTWVSEFLLSWYMLVHEHFLKPDTGALGVKYRILSGQ